VHDGSLTLIGCRLLLNAVGENSYGGAIRAYSSVVEVSQCDLSRNRSGDLEPGGGGAIHVEDSSLFIIASSFERNLSGGGSALDIERSTADVESTRFDGNSAGIGYSGSGGAVWAEDSTLNLRDCQFENNKVIARGSGGALTIIRGHTTLESCLLVHNVAGYSRGAGGAIHVDGIAGEAIVDIIQSTIAGNRASTRGGALDIENDATVTLDRSIVWGNCSPNDGEITTLDAGIRVVATCSILDPDHVSGEGSFEPDGSTSASDPRFCAPVLCESEIEPGDYAVAQNSPALPAYSLCGEQIGALSDGCDPVPIETTSWGAVKARFGP
jgi:hypothetical protein